MSMSRSSRFNPWPVGIGVFLACFLGYLVAFVVFSTRQRIDLVAPDYYERELRYQEQIDRVERTRAGAWEARVHEADGGRRLVIELPAEHASAGATGTVELYRPSAAEQDRTLPLRLDAAGRQTIDLRELADGLWRVRVQWKVGDQEYYTERKLVLRRPAGDRS
ncbi:MAG: hypothetical protein D6766_07325 [Verrucomicrobia bacterium]|nr:MAG: hypothetical protein D6766_07325 [Verrucomicrobiota bacterium]